MATFVKLTDAEVTELLERPKTLVISPKMQLFLDALGLNEFINSAKAQREIYIEAKRNGLAQVRTDEMQRRDWRVENALVIAMRRSLWGDRV